MKEKLKNKVSKLENLFLYMKDRQLFISWKQTLNSFKTFKVKL